jgi:PKHD-type hydroxylase|tara:strand:+ start:112 stop:654 length:543 start_codon:yes stop_codon:yes gene_type:complete
MKYFYYYISKYLDSKKLKELRSLLKQGKPFYQKAETKKTSKAFYTPFKKVKKILPDLEDRVFNINRESFGFNINKFLNDDPCVINIYNEKHKAEYDWHCDCESLNQNFTTKLTLLINLSEKKYEGGKLMLFTNSITEVISSFEEPGSIIVFPSYVPHKVTPVTKGERISGTFFITGPWWV